MQGQQGILQTIPKIGEAIRGLWSEPLRLHVGGDHKASGTDILCKGAHDLLDGVRGQRVGLARSRFDCVGE